MRHEQPKRMKIRVPPPATMLVALMIWACLSVRAEPLSSVTSSLSVQLSLRENFDPAVAQMVYRWDPQDLRPEPERRQALAKFIYESYDSSAWIPQSVIDACQVYPFTPAAIDAIIRDRVGLVLWPQNRQARLFGMAPNPRPDRPLSWTLNCLACHTAEIDGVAYFGAGNKALDEMVLGNAAEKLTDLRQRSSAAIDPADQTTADRAHDILQRHHHPAFDPLTRGRSTAFPASHVEMHMRAHRGAMPDAADVGRGDVKTPPLWHAAAKMPFQRWYCDGSFAGAFPLMASSMELALDQSFDKLATSVLPTIQSDFQSVIQFLRPPPYPLTIDPALAARGKQLFESDKIGCATCHGTYDGRGNVQWTGLHADVGTDPARLRLVSGGFVDVFEHSPLSKVGRLHPSKGYAATPLTGVWANFPYLHNGSVPTLHHLLGPVSERPRMFSVLAARRFDPVKVGQPLAVDEASNKSGDEAEILREHSNDRDWFCTERPGCGNQGHDFWSRIATDDNRRALIEYLKTL